MYGFSLSPLSYADMSMSQPNINRILAVEEHHRFLFGYLCILSYRSSLLWPDIFFFNCALAAIYSPISRATKKVKVDYVKARQNT